MVCVSPMRVAWLTIDRLRSDRDIRLSTATMRALNSRRPRSTTGIHRLASRSALCFFFLLCVLHDTRARSVPHDDGDVVTDQVHGKISEPVEVSDSNSDDVNVLSTKDVDQAQRKSLIKEEQGGDKDNSDERRKNPEEEILIEDSEKIQVEATGDEGSVAKKRRRNDVTLPGKSVLQDVAENAQKNDGIRRFDVQVEPDDTEGLDQQKISGDITKNIPNSQEDAIDYQRRLIEIRQSHVDVKNVDTNLNNEDRAEPEKKQYAEYAEIPFDLRENLDNIASLEQMQKTDLKKEETGQIENLAEHNLDEARIENIDDVNEEVRNDLRSLDLTNANKSERYKEEHADNATNSKEIDVKDLDLNREDRHLTVVSGKSKYRSSTVYLNAEEGNLPGREQESIVDGQIKKLLSIRDDALESVSNDAKHLEKLDKDDLLSEKLVEIDVIAAEKDEEIRSERSRDIKETSSQSENLDQSYLETGLNRLQNWKDQAALLQEQIKNRTFLHYLREQAIEVLPGIPKFTENQLLETLKNIVLLRKSPSNETYWASLNEIELNKEQLEIIKCAEQLVETKQRQSFVENMTECIRGLNVLNCMRIFVWPVVLNNLPESVSQTLSNLPIEINLIDLFQGNRAKSARSESSVHRLRLLTPESVVFSILKSALESKATYDPAPTFIDSKNETLSRLLTIGQLQILQMAEKLLPGELRREYSDRMFSCVRRFEYFSCIKYFAWPMIKQYHPGLPAFPDYQSWYPPIMLYPQYPIVPFPSFVEITGELPEVVEADATRNSKPEAVIVDILRNTLKEHAKVPLPSVAHNTHSYVDLLSPEQLLSIHMAELLLPIPYRSEFVQKTVKCIQEFNYLTCIKYSTWPTVRQFFPTLPDISNWVPNLPFPGNVFGNFPGFELPTLSLPDLSTFIPIFGSGGSTPPATEQPPQSGDSNSEESTDSPALIRQNEIFSKASNELEYKVIEILTKLHNSLRAIPENPQSIVSGNVIILTTITEKQVKILQLAESMVPPPVRAPLVTQVLSCLQTNDFMNCTRYVIWPTVALYIPNFPEFPDMMSKQQPTKLEDQQTLLKDKNTLHQPTKDQQEWSKLQNTMNPNVKIISRTKFPQSNSPVISVTGTRFVPIFTEHPESVILNILKMIQLSSPNVRDDIVIKEANNEQFDLLNDLLNDQQLNILKISEGLLPDAVRPIFVNRITECIRKENFVMCSRDVLWPTLSKYFSRLPNFPNFGEYPQAIGNKPILHQNLTDPSPFSETDVKIDQHGDATLTTTDTRFIPIFSEHPEGLILRILLAVRNSAPNVLTSVENSRLPEVLTSFTEQQANIVQVAESLLPESIRQVFVERMVTCVRDNTFLECTRDIVWPTIAQFFPRLPNFPNFGSYQSMPRMKINLSSILLRNAYPENQTLDEKSEDTPMTVVETIEDKIENILKELLSKGTTPRLENSYLDVNNPAIGALLTTRQMNIIRLTEKAIPDPIRSTYVTNMLECVKSNNFITCTQHINWPILKQYLPALPNFEELLGQFQIPGLDQIPDISGQIPDVAGQLPNYPGIGNPFEGPSIPQFPPQFPPQIPMLPGGIPGGIPQFPSQIPILPGGIQPGIPQFPEVSPSFGGITAGYPQFGILSDAVQEPNTQKLNTQELYSQELNSQELKPQKPKSQEPKTQEQKVQSRDTHAVEANQISGISKATNTPSVDEQGSVLGYLGQPTDILIDISKEKVQLSDIEQQQDLLSKSVPSNVSPKGHERRRRSTEQLLNSYYQTDGEDERTLETTMDSTFLNITESDFLQLLVNISKSKKALEKKFDLEDPKEYFVDTLNSTIRNSLTADQYEILKIVEDLDEQTTNRSFLSRVVQCIVSLSFIRCMGIFVWPVITSTVPSLIGLPSLPALPFLGRSTETEVEHYFGMSTTDFEKELLTRKEFVENILLDWYKKMMEDKFQTDLGFLKINGYGNGEVGISFGGFREGRATKIKDNKNLPSILTIISDIMEEVLDQRPDNEKIKKDKEKRERSLYDMQETDFQFLKESEEYANIKRSINDDQIITMFLDKIKANATDFADGDVAQFLNVEDAYNAFGVLFGTRLNEKFANRLKAFTEEHLKKDNPGDHVKELNAEELKMIPLKGEITYDLEKESMESHEERKKEHRAKNKFRSLWDKYSNKLLKNIPTDEIEDPDDENKIDNTESFSSDKNTRSELTIQLPRLREDIMSRKITSTIIQLGRALKTKMSNMMPGIGFIVTFLIQMALAHARAAASMAGMISNMALASAMFGMIRQNLFGSENPKIKYVYDNDKTGPGITWSHHDEPHYHGK